MSEGECEGSAAIKEGGGRQADERRYGPAKKLELCGTARIHEAFDHRPQHPAHARAHERIDEERTARPSKLSCELRGTTPLLYCPFPRCRHAHLVGKAVNTKLSLRPNTSSTPTTGFSHHGVFRMYDAFCRSQYGSFSTAASALAKSMLTLERPAPFTFAKKNILWTGLRT